MMRKIFFFICFLLISFKQGYSQLNLHEHPLLVQQLKTAFFDTSFKSKQLKIIQQDETRELYFTSKTHPLEGGKVYFTIEDCYLNFGSSVKSKKSNSLLPKGSMVWIIGRENNYDSIKISDSKFFFYFVYYKVYVPSLKKNAIISSKYLPDFCISTRGYTNLDTLKPQITDQFQQYHSVFKNVTKENNKDFSRDTFISINKFISNWIKIHDRVFQFYVRPQPDSANFQIYIETGLVLAAYDLTIDSKQKTTHLGSTIFPWIHGARGLLGVRNIIEIEHWAEACGQEGGSTFFTFIEQPTIENGMVKLGDFHSISEAGAASYSESLIFPSDTLIVYFDPANTDFKIIGKPNFLIQFNKTTAWQEFEETFDFENHEFSQGDELGFYSNVSTDTEIKYSKWNRDPSKFKKIKLVNPCQNNDIPPKIE